MAKKVKGLELNLAGFNELRKDPALIAMLQQEADRVLSAADNMTDGAGFEIERAMMPTRAVFYVRAATPEAARACQERNVLLKAVGR